MKPNYRLVLKSLGNIFVIIFLTTLTAGLIFGSYVMGYKKGTKDQYELDLKSIASFEDDMASSEVYVSVTPEPTLPPTKPQATPFITWGGPDLWAVVNATRVQNGVGELMQADELCTIASIRLNEILDLGDLDGHAGFSNLAERRPDLKWIFDKYGQVAEFLVSGATSAQHAVDLWYNTLGHKKLLTGGEYVKGCIYAQSGFGVAITAF